MGLSNNLGCPDSPINAPATTYPEFVWCGGSSGPSSDENYSESYVPNDASSSGHHGLYNYDYPTNPHHLLPPGPQYLGHPAEVVPRMGNRESEECCSTDYYKPIGYSGWTYQAGSVHEGPNLEEEMEDGVGSPGTSTLGGETLVTGRPPGRRRNTANKKERRRTQSINNAFAELRDCIPNVPPDTKLSKLLLEFKTPFMSSRNRLGLGHNFREWR